MSIGLPYKISLVLFPDNVFSQSRRIKVTKRMLMKFPHRVVGPALSGNQPRLRNTDPSMFVSLAKRHGDVYMKLVKRMGNLRAPGLRRTETLSLETALLRRKASDCWFDRHQRFAAFSPMCQDRVETSEVSKRSFDCESSAFALLCFLVMAGAASCWPCVRSF